MEGDKEQSSNITWYSVIFLWKIGKIFEEICAGIVETPTKILGWLGGINLIGTIAFFYLMVSWKGVDCFKQQFLFFHLYT